MVLIARLCDCAQVLHDLVQPDQPVKSVTVQCTAQLELPHGWFT